MNVQVYRRCDSSEEGIVTSARCGRLSKRGSKRWIRISENHRFYDPWSMLTGVPERPGKVKLSRVATGPQRGMYTCMYLKD